MQGVEKNFGFCQPIWGYPALKLCFAAPHMGYM